MVLFENFFNKLFGIRGNHQPPNQEFEDHRQYGDRFRNPIWQMDDDDDDDEAADFRHPGQGTHFSIFTDPFEMTRYFESQMDAMLKNIFQGFGQGFGHGFGRGFGDAVESFGEHGSVPALPAPSRSNLRDQFLKPGYENPPEGSDTRKLDTDLDGRLRAADLGRVWKKPDSVEPAVPSHAPSFSFNSFGRSITSQTIRRADGTMEHRRTVTDSEGNTRTTITRKIGDKTQTIETTRDKNGVETKTENLINIGEDQLADFEDKWKLERKNEPGRFDSFPWYKFFGFAPKL